jgi:hypothetical protein
LKKRGKNPQCFIRKDAREPKLPQPFIRKDAGIANSHIFPLKMKEKDKVLTFVKKGKKCPAVH